MTHVLPAGAFGPSGGQTVGGSTIGGATVGGSGGGGVGPGQTTGGAGMPQGGVVPPGAIGFVGKPGPVEGTLG